jgi:hypothetical protein
MNPTRLVLPIVAGLCVVLSQPARAVDAAPFTPDKQFSADEVMTMKDGMSVASKVYTDNGKVRTEINQSGMQMISIIRPDQKKMYTVMPAQKMVMTMALDPAKMNNIPSTSFDDFKFESIGPDLVDGAACTKYKMTAAKGGKVFFWWVNVATKAPVKMASEDGTFTVSLKNYKVGPQDAALFEPPADYQVMAMPGAPSEQ